MLTSACVLVTRICYQLLVTSGFELTTTITHILQANQQSKCTSQPDFLELSMLNSALSLEKTYKQLKLRTWSYNRRE